MFGTSGLSCVGRATFSSTKKSPGRERGGGGEGQVLVQVLHLHVPQPQGESDGLRAEVENPQHLPPSSVVMRAD